MNSYNENLRSIVFDSIQNREMEQKKLNAQLNSAKVALYYSQGARISAQEKLDAARNELSFRSSIKDEAVKNANLSVNILGSAGQQKNYMDLSVTNTATCASNVQIAANAILKLSSNVGSIFSIVNAADYGVDIFSNAQDVKNLMDQTAYHAEVASQMAMKVSSNTAKVSYKRVASQAALTDNSLKGILATIDSEYDKSSAAVTTDSTTLAADSNKEKLAEGKLEDINVDYYAAVSAYQSLNEELNLDLAVSINHPDLSNNPQTGRVQTTAKAVTPSSFTLSFNSILSPFQGTEDPATYPVKSYLGVLVKNNKRSIFTIADAESLSLKEPPTGKDYYINIPVPASEDDEATGSMFLSAEVETESILDSDGDAFNLGQEYVVFVYAVYTDDYKRLINDFENFLSAPSGMFSITHLLASPLADNISVKTTEHVISSTNEVEIDLVQTNEGKISAEVSKDDSIDNQEKIVSSVLAFQINSAANNDFKVKHRCMFLPTSNNLVKKGLLTRKSLLTQSKLQNLEGETEAFESIYSQYDTKVLVAEENIKLAEQAVDKVPERSHLEDEINSKKDIAKKTKQDRDDLAQWRKELKEVIHLNAVLDDARRDLKEIMETRQDALEEINTKQQERLGFFFDLDLAGQVSEANYYTPEQVKSSEAGMERWIYVINSNTTDNFGVPLIVGKEYLPVVLTVSDAEEVDLDDFSSALSNYDDTAPFVYQTLTTPSNT